MPRVLRLLVVFGSLSLGVPSLAGVSACGKKSGSGEKEAVKWPDAPKGDVPLVIEFQSMDKRQGKEPRANLRVFNFTTKPVKRMYALLHYWDAAGKEIKDFPWNQIGRLPDGKDWSENDVGFFIPDECTKVTGDVREVEFGDGSTWKAPEKDDK